MSGLRRYDKRVKYAFLTLETRVRKARALVYAAALKEQPKQLTWWMLFTPVKGLLQGDRIEFQKILDSLVRRGLLLEYCDMGKMSYIASVKPEETRVGLQQVERHEYQKEQRREKYAVKRGTIATSERKEKDAPVIKRTEEINWESNEF